MGTELPEREGDTGTDHPYMIRGPVLKVGDKAPSYALVGNKYETVTDAEFAGKTKLISVVPSLDTRTCDAQTRRFNEEAANFDESVVVLTVSADLPPAQRRWCGAAGVDRVITLSCHKDMKFADDYGVHHAAVRMCSRAVFVVDDQDIVQYVELVDTRGKHPDYDAALAALETLTKA